MTNEEHIIYAQNLCVALRKMNCFSAETMESLDEAIKALEQKSSDDCVSRQAMLKEIPRLWNSKGDKDYCMETLRDFVTELPPVTPTCKKGRWIKEYDNSALDGLYHCSICGRRLWIPKEQSFSDYPYCHCGAEMENEE